MFIRRASLRMGGTGAPKERSGGTREIGFWLLLLGSWMMLNSPAWPNQLLGGLGTAAFLILAFGSLGKLRGMGMEYAAWERAPAGLWFWAAALGVAAGSAGWVWARSAHAGINVADNWRVFLLQVALGPVLEESVFRGYLIQLLYWIVKVWMQQKLIASALVVLISAVAFGTIHLLRPGTTWIEVAVISGLGAIYGFIRVASGSSATAAVAHAVYNLTLHIGTALAR